MLNKSLSILIPNYNGRKLLEEFLPHTFVAAKNSKLPFEVIIVDDASTDDSVAFIKFEYPEIILHVNTFNQGFSKSCNVGICIAKNPLLLILNSDIKLSPTYFLNQLKYFDISSTFGVMSKIEDHNNPNHKERSQTIKRFGLKITRKSITCNYLIDQIYPSVFLSGANTLVDLKKIKTLGGFNELFSPFYGEDFDLSIRAWRMGWRCYFDNFSSCEHLGSVSIKKSTNKKMIKTIYYRNKFILNASHLNPIENILFDIQSILCVVLPKVLIGKFWIIKSFGDYLKLKATINVKKKGFKNLLLSNNSDISVWQIKTIIKNIHPH